MTSKITFFFFFFLLSFFFFFLSFFFFLLFFINIFWIFNMFTSHFNRFQIQFSFYEMRFRSTCIIFFHLILFFLPYFHGLVLISSNIRDILDVLAPISSTPISIFSRNYCIRDKTY